MNIVKKHLPKSQLELTVEVPYIKLSAYFEKTAKEISKNFNMPGFRAGKAPLEIVKQRIGKEKIWNDSISEAIQDTLMEAFSQKKLEVIGQPSVEIKSSPVNPEKTSDADPSLNEDKRNSKKFSEGSLIYTAIVSLLPQVNLNNYKSMVEKKKEISVESDDIAAALEKLRKHYAKESAIDRPIRKGDKVVLDMNMSLNKIPLEGCQFKNHQIIVGDEIIIKGFNENMIGMTKGSEKNFILEFPKNHFDKNLAGKEIEFKIKINEAYEIIAPELNDDFAKVFGNYQKLDELKSEIEKNIKVEKERQEDARIENALLDKLVEQAEYEDIPDVLMKEELDKIIEEMKINITAQGGNFEDYLTHIKKTVDNLRKDFTEQALKRIKTALAIRKIAETENIKVEDGEIEKEISKILKDYRDKKIEKNVKTNAYRSYLKNILANRKVINKLKEWNT